MKLASPFKAITYIPVLQKQYHPADVIET